MNKGANQFVDQLMISQISASMPRCLDGMIAILDTSVRSVLKHLSVSEQADLRVLQKTFH